MLINRVSDERAAGAGRGTMGVGTGAPCAPEPHDHSEEYQTASELFELMAKDHAFDINDSTLSTSDLVILYKNIDLGTRLLSTTNELKRPNQHVETIVYNDDADSDSDLSEIYSNENLHDVFHINKERIDLLNAPLSLENTLCHKLGDLELQTHALATDYDKHFLFKDPYIKEQLKNFNSKEIHNTILPSSLLDYICCKRLEDNNNFYMENVIGYVKNTIEQLKRISNGDYLTDKAKQKWREVERYPSETESNKKILATSTSIPLHVERKVLPGHISIWDDFVHSEVDLQSLSKILEKKIFLEVPKIICGSYRLFSKRCADNLVISCKTVSSSEVKDDEKKSGVDVVLKLKRSESGYVNSIMILQKSQHNLHEFSLPDILPLPTLEKQETFNKMKNNVKIVELDDQEYDATKACSPKENLCSVLDTASNSDSNLVANALAYSECEHTSSVPAICNNELVAPNVTHKNILNSKLTGALSQDNGTFNHVITPDELRFSMCKLDIQTCLPEESFENLQCQVDKKKSPTRVRIKSPYENKSYVIEEKKRKKLLEIRDRREKKKMAFMKHKYGGNRMPQSSSSVTKLSITNKSFYNSIYGRNDDKEQKAKKCKKASVLDITEEFSEERNVSLPTPDRNNKKYINRSFYLDDTVTEITRMQMKKNNMDMELCSPSTSSAVSTDLGPHNSIWPQFIKHRDIECEDNPLIIQCETNEELEKPFPNIINEDECSKYPSDSQSPHNVVPVNTPKDAEVDEMDLNNVVSTVEFRKSIDKIYDLMKKPVKNDTPEKTSLKIKLVDLENIDATSTYRDSSTGQASDSGTSLKHQHTLSDDSGFSFQYANNSDPMATKLDVSETKDKPATVVPKIIISTKSQTQKMDSEKYKKDRKKVTISNPKTVVDNPLKAISHLLHEFENVQKSRQKGSDAKSKRKVETVITDGQNSGRQRPVVRRSRFDQQITNREQISPKNVNKATAKDRKPTAPADIPKSPHQKIPVSEKNNDKYVKKKISDIIDEAMEARGEAVRGPSKTSRLNSLAQPKKSYVQAHSEEFQNKYGRNLMTDRLQRLAGTPQPPLVLEKNIVFSNWRKLRRTGPEVISPMSVKQPLQATSPLGKEKQRSLTSSSPVGYKRPPTDPPCKTNHVGNSPEILKNKMGVVESYVKLHYGGVSQAATAPSGEAEVHKSRIPLIPTDLELLSLTSSPTAEESTALGNKLHNLIDTMFSSISPALDALSECPETNSQLSNADDSIGEQFSKEEKPVSVGSVDHIDVFNDRNVCTAIEYTVKEDDHSNKIKFENVENKCDLNTFNSATEMHILENALRHKISIGSFQKRLKTKKLTLTPKQSMQQVVILQPGDANSLILKEPHRQNLKINFESCSENISALEIPLLTNSHSNWNFAEIPIHISTVGFTFPTYQRVQDSVGENMNSILCNKIRAKNENSSLENRKLDIKSKCYKEQQNNLNARDMDQVDTYSSSDIPMKNYQKPVISAEDNINKLKSVDIKIKPFAGHNEANTNPKVNIAERTNNDKSDNIDYTNSLDMLVALLNEIQKITTCQTLVNSSSEDVHRKQLETMLNNGTTRETVMNGPCELISITSVDKLRQLDSNPSIYSLFLCNGKEHETIENETCMTPEISSGEKIRVKPVYSDKEISVDIPNKLYSDMFTDVPSRLFTDTVNHSTKITNSLTAVLSKQSSQSMTCYKDYHKAYSNASIHSQKKIIAVSVGRNELKNCLSSFEIDEKLVDQNNIDDNKSNMVLTLKIIHNIETKTKETCIPKLMKTVSKTARAKTNGTFEIYGKLSDVNTILSSKTTDNIETNFKEVFTPKLMKRVSKPKYYVTESENEPVMKIKRDILVTLYSVLVFTVFAALSFPELVYHV